MLTRTESQYSAPLRPRRTKHSGFGCDVDVERRKSRTWQEQACLRLQPTYAESRRVVMFTVQEGGHDVGRSRARSLATIPCIIYPDVQRQRSANSVTLCQNKAVSNFELNLFSTLRREATGAYQVNDRKCRHWEARGAVTKAMARYREEKVLAKMEAFLVTRSRPLCCIADHHSHEPDCLWILSAAASKIHIQFPSFLSITSMNNHTLFSTTFFPSCLMTSFVPSLTFARI